MVKVMYIEADGREYEVEIAAGDTVMQGAVDHLISGILAECGGSCSCATCHCYVDEAWVTKIPDPSDTEEDMLSAVEERKPTSRLSCQITMTDGLDGLVVRLPESQY